MELKTYFAQDRAGNLIPNATVTIYLTGTNTLATGLKTSNDAALSNPFTTGADGKIQFKAADGIYDMVVSYGTQTGPRITIQCLDQAGQVAAAQQATADAEAARDQTQQIINDAGEQSTLVVLAQPDGLKNIGRLSSAAALRALNPTVKGQKFDLISYYANGSSGGGLFYYDDSDTTSPDNGGTCFVTASGKRIKRIFTGPVRVEWFGSDGLGLAKKVSDFISEGYYASLAAVQAIYPRVTSTDDYFDLAAITNAMAACTAGQVIEFSSGGTYHLNRTASGGKCSGAIGSDTKIVISNTSVGMTALSFGNQKGVLSPTSLSTVAQSRSISVPGISALASVGDLVSFSSKDVRLPTNEATGVRAYNHGWRAVIVSMSGDDITIDRDFYASFSVSAVTVHTGHPSMSLKGLTFDATAVPSVSYLVNCASFVGTNIDVSGCIFRGSSYCNVGLSVIGSVAHVHECWIGGFCNLNSIESGGRSGYGVYVDCHDTLLQNNYYLNNKHHATCASRDFVMRGFTVRGGSSKSEKSSLYNVMASFDLHANIIGTPVFEGINIDTAGAAFGIRNGSARICKNTIRIRRESDATPGMVGIDEWLNVDGIFVEDNTIDGSSNVSMFNFGVHDTIKNIYVRRNKGTIGSIINQQANFGSLSNLSLERNDLSSMTKIIEISKRGPSSPLTLLTLIDGLSSNSDVFQVSNTLGNPPIYIWGNALTAVSDKLELRNFSLVNTRIDAADTPIKLAYLKCTGKFVINGVNLIHAVSAGTSTAPTQYSAVFENCSFSESYVSMNAPGAIVYTGSTAYPDEVLSYKLNFNNCNLNAILFSDARNSAGSYMQFLTGCSISDCTLYSTYGSKIAFIVTRTNTGWASSGIFDISNCRIFGGSGASIFISAGYTGNKIAARNNIWTVAMSDLSGTNYQSTGNILVS